MAGIVNPDMKSDIIPVIISGGSGTRLWPVSRHSLPKQFCDFLDESLFHKAIKRVLPLGTPWTVTVQDLRILTERALQGLGVPGNQVIYEPRGRNTAPALALLCRIFELQGRSAAVVGVFPADQLVSDEEKFRAAVRTGAQWAAAGHVVTLGVAPTYPATGYGYIETAGPMSGAEASGDSGANALRATRFREKPNEDTARAFIKQGGFFWNAGMFIFRISRMIELLSTHAPEIWKALSQLKADLSNLIEIYDQVQAISIDYAVMERLPGHVCIPCEFNWSDLGSWDAMADIVKPSEELQRATVEVGGQNNFVFSSKSKAYGLVGVEDLIVVDTPDALLVAKKGSSERVKEVVEKLKERKITSAVHHPSEVRPWGRFDILADERDFKSKTVTVDPGHQLSYQSHKRRSEHWIIVKGAGEVILNDEVLPVAVGTHIHIPMGAKHRIRNSGIVPLQFVEVQLGDYFGEDDIVRYQDDYRRT